MTAAECYSTSDWNELMVPKRIMRPSITAQYNSMSTDLIHDLLSSLSHNTETPFVWLCDLRRPTYKDHRRPVFCRCRPTSVELSLPTELRQSDRLGQFKRQLKTHLFGLRDQSA